VMDNYVDKSTPIGDPMDEIEEYVRSHKLTRGTPLAMRQIINDISNELANYSSMSKVPPAMMPNFRNDMYLVSESLRLMQKSGKPPFTAGEHEILANYKKHIDGATKFIPGWVKVAVALALGLGTMVGWKRIVVTVGEKIGKDHLAYGQGAAAEITAAATIAAADHFGCRSAPLMCSRRGWPAQ
jgi:inorganic phosphate transporter, PiT family